MMTPAQFKAARAAVIEASKWNDSRIRGEMAECIEIRTRPRFTSQCQPWSASEPRPSRSLAAGACRRERPATASSCRPQPSTTCASWASCGSRGEAIELVDDALAAAVNNGGDPRVRVRRHSAHTVVDVATVAGWAAHAVDPESFATCKAHEHVDITLHAEPVAGREPLSSRMPRSMPAETGCEVCGAWWLMTPDGSVCVNGHHPRRGWT